MLASDVHTKGAYAEGYDDHEPGLAVGFRLDLTPATWPADWGGHYEVLDALHGEVVSSHAPAWNSLDLFDLRQPGAWRRMPMLCRQVDGFVISGSFAG